MFLIKVTNCPPSTLIDFRFAVIDGIPELLASRGSSRGEGKGVAVALLHRTLHIQFGGGNGGNGGPLEKLTFLQTKRNVSKQFF